MRPICPARLAELQILSSKQSPRQGSCFRYCIIQCFLWQGSLLSLIVACLTLHWRPHSLTRQSIILVQPLWCVNELQTCQDACPCRRYAGRCAQVRLRRLGRLDAAGWQEWAAPAFHCCRRQPPARTEKPLCAAHPHAPHQGPSWDLTPADPHTLPSVHSN